MYLLEAIRSLSACPWRYCRDGAQAGGRCQDGVNFSWRGAIDMPRSASWAFGGLLAFWCSSPWALGGVKFDARSARSGKWSEPATWEEGRIPRAGDRVQVRSGHDVSYDVLSSG